MRLSGHEGGACGEGFLDLEVGGLALADVAGVDAVGDLVSGLQVGGVGDDGLVEGDVEREEYVEAGTRIVARVDEALAAVIAREAVGGTVGDAAVSGA